MSKLNKHNPLAKAVKYALLAASASMAYTAPTVFAAEEEEAEEKENKVTITGTRIKRADIESASPVTVVGRLEMELSGLTDVGDLFQSIPCS